MYTRLRRRESEPAPSAKEASPPPMAHASRGAPAWERALDFAPPIVHQALQAPGHALDGTTRTSMEKRFGADFGGVRVHSDHHAEESARAVNAAAYTVGPNVVFGAGQYAPNSASGQKLLAHEL